MGPRFIQNRDESKQLQEERGVLQQMVSPPQTPDPNLMESVWDDRRDRSQWHRGTEEQWQGLQDALGIFGF